MWPTEIKPLPSKRNTRPNLLPINVLVHNWILVWDLSKIVRILYLGKQIKEPILCTPIDHTKTSSRIITSAFCFKSYDFSWVSQWIVPHYDSPIYESNYYICDFVKLCKTCCFLKNKGQNMVF